MGGRVVAAETLAPRIGLLASGDVRGSLSN